MIVSAITLPNGASATVHRLLRVDLTDDGATATINSYADRDAGLIIWQDRYAMPLEVLASASYPDSVNEWIVSPSGPCAGGEIVADPSSLEALKATFRARITAKRDAIIAGGCMTPAGPVDTDEVSIRNILGAYQSAVASMMVQQPMSIVWRMADNTLATLDAIGVIAMGNAVLASTQRAYARSWTLKDLVDAAEDEATVAAIDVDAGW